MVSPDTVCSAINARHLVTFVYHDHDRVVMPLIVFRGKNNRWQLHGWQFDGTTSGGEKLPCFRDPYLDEIEDFADSGDSFSDSQIPPGYNPENPKFRESLCKVPKS